MKIFFKKKIFLWKEFFFLFTLLLSQILLRGTLYKPYRRLNAWILLRADHLRLDVLRLLNNLKCFFDLGRDRLVLSSKGSLLGDRNILDSLVRDLLLVNSLSYSISNLALFFTWLLLLLLNINYIGGLLLGTLFNIFDRNLTLDRYLLLFI